MFASQEEKMQSLVYSESWSLEKICQEFKTTEYLVTLTMDQVKNQGMLRDLSKKKGVKLSEEV